MAEYNYETQSNADREVAVEGKSPDSAEGVAVSERAERSELITKLVHQIERLLSDGNDYSCQSEILSTQRPTPIGEFRPDVLASARVRGQKVELVGETCSDLNGVAIPRLLTFLEYVEKGSSRGLIVAVPCGAKNLVLPLLADYASDWTKVQARVMVLDH